MAHAINQGDLVLANVDYEVSVGGDYELLDLVPCRRVIDTNGPICAFLCASVLGIESTDMEPLP